MKKQVSVEHWRYEDGWSAIPYILQDKNVPADTRPTKEFDPADIGWRCWIYTHDYANVDIDTWMKKNMTGEYECIHRFNSGNPMHTIFITSDEDATLFKLTWM